MALSEHQIDSIETPTVALPRTGPLPTLVKVHFTVLDASESLAQTSHFYQRQHACYQRFRSEAAARPHKRRTSWNGVRLVAAFDPLAGALCGGVGVFERKEGAPLPVELALGSDPNLAAALDRWAGQRIFEVSGLWVEEQWRRTGLSTQLMRVAMATATFHKADKIVGFSHQHVLDFYGTIGLIPDSSVGSYNYPDEKYVSTFIWADPPALTTASPETRAQIFHLVDRLNNGNLLTWLSAPRRDGR